MNFMIYNSIIIFCAKYLYIAAILGFVISFFLLPKNTRKSFILLTIFSLPCVFLVSRLAGHFYLDPRPFVAGHFTPLVAHSPDNGFPSDHALLTGSLAAISFFFNKKTGAALWLIVLIVGAARVLAGVHHWVDILGAMLISILVITLIDLVLKKQRILLYNRM